MGKDTLPVKKGPFRAGGSLSLVIVVLYLALFFAVPYGTVLITGIAGRGAEGEILWTSILKSGYYRRILGFTFYQALLSTIFSLLLGIPGAYLLARYSLPGKRIIKALCTVPFVLPSILVVLGFVLFFGNSGYLNKFLMLLFSLDEPPLKVLYSLKAIILAHTFYNFPISLRLVSSAWEREPENLVQAGRILGAGRFRSFRTITFPYLLPSISASALLTFLYCFNSFAVILVLGGGPKFTTLEVEIYRLARMELNYSLAAGLSILSAAVSLGTALLYLRLLKPSRGDFSATGLKQPKRLSKGSRLIFIFYSSLVFILIFAPILSVVVRSLIPASGWDSKLGFTLAGYRELFVNRGSGEGSILSSVYTSLLVAVLTCLIAGFMGTLTGYWSAREKGYPFLLPLSLLPLGVSSLILSLGYSKLMPVLSQGNPYIILAVIHSILAFPFVSQSTAAAARNITPSLRNSAAVLGASPAYLFRTLEMPLLLPALLSGLSFTFAISLGEFQGALMILSGRASTIPITLYRLIGAYNFNGACALGTVLIILCTAVFFIILKTERRTE